MREIYTGESSLEAMTFDDRLLKRFVGRFMQLIHCFLYRKEIFSAAMLLHRINISIKENLFSGVAKNQSSLERAVLFLRILTAP